MGMGSEQDPRLLHSRHISFDLGIPLAMRLCCVVVLLGRCRSGMNTGMDCEQDPMLLPSTDFSTKSSDGA